MESGHSEIQAAIDLHSRQADTFSLRYDRLATDPFTDCFTYSRWRLQELLDRYLPARGDNLRLLDVGCGTGHLMADLRGRGFEVAGIDGSEEMLAHARRLNPQAVIQCADVDHIPFEDGFFDHIVCIEVLRYLPRSDRCLREMARVLKPGGQCLFTATPAFNLNAYWLINRLARAVPLGNLVRLKQYFTTSGRLQRELREAGFSAVSIDGVYFGPINWVERLSRRSIGPVLRWWLPMDRAMASRNWLRNVANMFLVRATRAESSTSAESSQ